MLWQPSAERIESTNLHRFIGEINDKYKTDIGDYPALHRWSVENLPDFWASVWEFCGIKASKPWTEVIDDPKKMPGAKWFSGARMNFAENLLRFRDERCALIFKGEAEKTVRLSYAELFEAVAKLAKSLRDAGVTSGDRVVGFMPNMPESIIAMLAATSIGAVWSSCSPDFGIKGVLDRFGQIRPKVLFTADGYFFKGKKLDCLERVAGIMVRANT
jgi:acetoacetyl-CoA synthetase